MKRSILIAVNWVFSFCGLCITEPFFATMIGVAWFCASCVLLNYADKKGWMAPLWESKLGKFLDTEN
jgi:hypothetical protein